MPNEVTLRQQPDLQGVPDNIQRELEFLRSNSYTLLGHVNALSAAATGATGLTIQAGLSAKRPKAGTGFYYSTDHTVAWFWDTGWKYAWGYDRGLLAAISNAGGVKLGPNDTGLLYYATDYFHAYAWDGGQWHFAAGDASQYIVVGVGAPPSGGLWGLCDGSTYVCATDAGSTASVVSPTVTDGYLRR